MTKNITPYHFILDRIISCEYPPGSSISDKYIISDALNLGLSYGRTPVREALLKLEMDKFINIFSRKGMFVSDISVKLVNAVFYARKIIEPTIVLNYGHKIYQSNLQALENRFDEDIKQHNLQKLILDDGAFHSYIIALSNNDILIDVMKNILLHSQRIRVLSYRNNKRLGFSNKEHKKIIEELKSNRTEKASIELANHIEASRKAALS